LAHLSEPETYAVENYDHLLDMIRTTELRLRVGLVDGKKDSLFVYDENFVMTSMNMELFPLSLHIDNLSSEIQLFANILDFGYSPDIVEDFTYIAERVQVAAKNMPDYILNKSTGERTQTGNLDCIPDLRKAKVATEEYV